jgi:hypothetical protein
MTQHAASLTAHAGHLIGEISPILEALVARLLRRPGRRCTRCGTWKPAAEFPPNPLLRSGLGSWCRGCKADANRRWRERTPDVNARRREGPFALVCVDCGEPFQGVRRDQKRCPEDQHEHARLAKNERQRRRRAS